MESDPLIELYSHVNRLNNVKVFKARIKQVVSLERASYGRHNLLLPEGLTPEDEGVFYLVRVNFVVIKPPVNKWKNPTEEEIQYVAVAKDQQTILELFLKAKKELASLGSVKEKINNL